MRLRSCRRLRAMAIAAALCCWCSFFFFFVMIGRRGAVSGAFVRPGAPGGGRRSRRQAAEARRAPAPPPARARSPGSRLRSLSREELDPRRLTTRRPGKGGGGVGGYDPSEKIGVESIDVGDPQVRVEVKDMSVTSILKELAAIQQQGPRKYCILGTRHCSYLHQQIIELLAYALVLSGNHVYTSGAGGTHAATIRGALRAERPDLLTVVLPQSLGRQTKESQELLEKVKDVVAMPQNDGMSLDIASRICNSYLLQLSDQLISFAFHESSTVIEASKEAKELNMLVTVLFLD